MEFGINSFLDKETREIINEDINGFENFLNNLSKPRQDVMKYRNQIKSSFNKYFVWSIIINRYFSVNKNRGNYFKELVKQIQGLSKNTIYVKGRPYGRNNQLICKNKLLWSLVSYFIKYAHENEIKCKNIYPSLKAGDKTKIQLIDTFETENEENITSKEWIKESNKNIENNPKDIYIDEDGGYAVIDGEVIPIADISPFFEV